MKSKKKHAIPLNGGLGHQDGEDIQNFLRALRSYPTHFARHPRTSFQQHLFNISAGQNASLRELRAKRG